ncbi:MAG: thioredoxin domain-containing protein [Clostridiales bacterium]|jgi:thioredoxin 2|nr:thioredoxin domain-containing protein [Clostridiales bacterium]
MIEKKKVSCFRCGATNYYPLDAEGKTVVCGRCKNALPVPGTVLELPPENVAVLIQHSVLPLLIDFYSPACAPCTMMHPVIERLAKRRAGEIMAIKLNVDRHTELAASFGVKGVPTFVVIQKGTERGRTSGAMAETDFSLWVASRT